MESPLTQPPGSPVTKVLCLEDDPDDADLLTSMLKVMDPTGFQVTIVRDMNGALNALQREGFDILIADYQLGQTDGRPSTELVLEVLRRSDYLPVLLITAHPHIPLDEALIEFLNEGRLRFMEKDRLSLENLQQELLIHLDRRYRVLIVEDDPDDLLFARELLAGSHPERYSFQFAEDIAQARARISEQDFDIYIIDWQIGPERSADLIQQLAETRPSACIVMLTGQEALELPAELLRLVGRQHLSICSKRGITAHWFERHVLRHLTRFPSSAAEPTMPGGNG